MDTIHSEQYKGYTLNIASDMEPESPREWDNLGLIVCFHDKYTLGDKHEYNHENYEGWEELRKAIVKDTKAIAWLPLFLYDHGGITMYTTGDTGYRQHEAWDSGQVGWIVLPKTEETKGMTKKKAEKILRQEIETYDQWLTGDVYGYVIADEENDHTDSCWGFYGMEYAIEAGKEAIDGITKEAQEKHEARLKAQIVHGVPLQYRTA